MRVLILPLSSVLAGCLGAGQTSSPQLASVPAAETAAAAPPTTVGQSASKPSRPDESTRNTPVILKNADIQAVQSGVREVLKDPESARFGKMIAGRSDKGVTTVCLLVNAKNSYGGYTGMKPFMGVLTNGPPQKFIVIPTRSSQYRDESVHTVCRRDGLAL